MAKRIIFVILALIFWPRLSEGSIILDRIIAIVNKDAITWSELYKAMEFEATDEVKAMKPEDRMKIFRDSEMTFLDNMIDMKLQIQEAAKIGIRATDEEINKAVDGIKSKYSMTDEMFMEALKKEGFTISEYKKKISEQIIINRLIDQEIRSKIIVTEREIDRHISENRDIAKENEGFVISHIFVNAANGEREGRKRAEEKAVDLYRRIKAGEDFSAVARQYSDGSNAASGGELGFIKKSDMSKDFIAVIDSLKEGDISEPFWSGSGFHIIKLTEKRELKTDQQIREMVRQKLLNERFIKDYKSWLRGLRERSYVEIKL